MQGSFTLNNPARFIFLLENQHAFQEPWKTQENMVFYDLLKWCEKFSLWISAAMPFSFGIVSRIWGHLGLPTGFLSIILLLSRLHDARSGCYMFTLTPIFVFSHQSVLSHPSLSAHTHPCILTPITVLSQPPIPILYISTHLRGSAL